MVKLLVGLLKGAFIGGAIGYGAYALAQGTGFNNPWLTFGLIGAFVGLLAGRPIWALLKDEHTTNIVGILKAAFGFGVGCGLYAIVAKAWNPAPMLVGGFDMFHWPVTVGGAIGAVYGGFVELDESIGDKGDKSKAAKPAKKLTS